MPFSFSETPVHTGQAAQVTCFVSEGDAPLDFAWSFQGRFLNSQEGVTITKIGRIASLLLIDHVTEAQIGNYTCTTKNKAGSVHYTATLFVYGTAQFLVLFSVFLFLLFFLVEVCVLVNKHQECFSSNVIRSCGV